MHKPMISGMKVISILVLIFAFSPQQLRTIEQREKILAKCKHIPLTFTLTT